MHLFLLEYLKPIMQTKFSILNTDLVYIDRCGNNTVVNISMYVLIIKQCIDKIAWLKV